MDAHGWALLARDVPEGTSGWKWIGDRNPLHRLAKDLSARKKANAILDYLAPKRLSGG